ncbi:MAG: hypothetical protein J0H43_04945, partial [Actinobacteria bacterium]|nr:hypothetical protein [Actinomycetota bacterium]
GDVQETIFDTAPGLTAEQHYQQLQQAGVVGLRDPNMAEAGPAVVAPCASGTARLECSNGHTLHWANNGYGHPQVYFVDHTGSAWPTDVSTYTWNQAQGIDSIYVWGSCPGYGGTHCVNVNDANYGNTGKWAGTTGLTYLTWNPTSYNFVDGKVYIQLNDYNFGLNAAGHRQDVCQEQGHSLGMDHNTATNSCMYQYIINSTGAETPDSADFSLIAELYSVSH